MPYRHQIPKSRALFPSQRIKSILAGFANRLSNNIWQQKELRTSAPTRELLGDHTQTDRPQILWIKPQDLVCALSPHEKHPRTSQPNGATRAKNQEHDRISAPTWEHSAIVVNLSRHHAQHSDSRDASAFSRTHKKAFSPHW
jgi:hypothetical protein